MQTKAQKDGIIGSLAAIGCEILYGLSYIFTKQATANASELALLGWRFLVAALAIILLRMAGIVRISLKGKSLKPLLLVALCCPCIYMLAETVGISRTTASESGVFLACIPVTSLIASAILLGEKPIGMQVLGILTTLAGVLVTVFAVSGASSFSFFGYAALLAGVLSYSMYSVLVSKAAGYSGAELTYVMLLAGAAMFIVLAIAESAIHGETAALLRMPFQDTGFLTAILYQGLGCSVCAFFLSNLAIEKIGVNRTSSFIGISTVVSILAGALLLGERFTTVQIVGAAVIIAGVYIANIKKGISE